MNHYRKITAVTALLVLCLTSKIFATGAGVQLSGNPGLFINEETVKLEKLTGKAVGTIRFSRIPVSVGFGLEAGKNFSEFAYGLTGFADYYAVDLQLKNTWNLYSGFGAEGSILTQKFEDWTVSAGARFFLGTNWLFWDNYLEFYIQQNVVPGFSKNLSAPDSKAAFMLNLPFEAGIRLHF